MKYTKENFIEKAIAKHGHKYDYSKVEYINSYTPVEIICPEHGSFFQPPYAHLRGDNCPKCGNLKRGKHLTTQVFIERLKKIYGDKYDLSKVNYVDSNTPITLTCPKHGEFEKMPFKLLEGQGCPKCANRNLTTEDIIEKFKEVHGDKYNYSKVVYTKMHDKVCIICPNHGEFWQTPSKHLKGQGCPKCGVGERSNKRKKSNEKFIEQSKIIHGDKYDYSKVNYVNAYTPIEIICPTHGSFMQRPYDHLHGHGCPKCAIDNSKTTLDDFIKKSKIIHSDKYDYSKVNYVNNYTPVEIICPEHGSFFQDPTAHLRGCGCPACSHLISKNELEIFNYLKNNLPNIKVISRDHTVLDKKELDIYIPDLKLGIEYNGIRWHSDEFHDDPNFHLKKLEECNKNGIKLIQIFEDEYINNKEIVLSKLRHAVGLDKKLVKIYGRKCQIREINRKEALEFLDKNHIQGFVNSSLYLGSFFKDKLIGVMSFLKENNSDNWNLTRFSTDINYLCCGVAGKLFDYFLRKYKVNEVKTFADRRWTTSIENNIYTKLGFVLDSIEKPDYSYVYFKEYGVNRVHKFNFRKSILNKKYGFPLTMTESEMTNKLNAHKIWNCGLLKFKYTNKGEK